MTSPRYLYLFLDESGNLDFSPNGTRYFMLSCVVKERPFEAYKELNELKYDLVECGVELEYFHATENKQTVRDKVFNVILGHLEGIKVESVVVEKRKVKPELRSEEFFYPTMLGGLISHIVGKNTVIPFNEIIIFTDRIPVNKKRDAVEKAINKTLASILPDNITHRILHHDSKSNMDLQIADYCCWAVQRKWQSKDLRSYDLIKAAMGDELQVYGEADETYY